jgi:hypothetical protein
MLLRAATILLCGWGLTAEPLQTGGLLARVAEEADVFYQNAPKTVTRETLAQRAAMPPSRFRPRVGRGAVAPPRARLEAREIVSEYTVGALRQSDAPDLVEFRQVISVDGHTVQSPENARHALSLGMASADDRLRKRMLESFASHGLVDIATDYGLILLAFTRRGMANLEIQPAGEGRIGTDEAAIFRWRQISTEGGALEFHGRKVARRQLQGALWVRRSDGLPLRIQAWMEHTDSGRKVRDEASVDYVMSAHAFLTPVSVIHRHSVDGQVTAENLYRYEPFRLFSADTEVRFTEIPEPPTGAPVQK